MSPLLFKLGPEEDDGPAWPFKRPAAVDPEALPPVSAWECDGRLLVGEIVTDVSVCEKLMWELAGPGESVENVQMNLFRTHSCFCRDGSTGGK